MKSINGLLLVGYPYTGKSTIANEISKHIENPQIIDKSKYLTYIPLSLGYNDDETLKHKTLWNLVNDIKEHEDLISTDIAADYKRSETVKFSDKLRNHFGIESGYNYVIPQILIQEGKFPIIVGARYMETLDYFSKQGYGIFGLELLDENELNKRSSNFNNLKKNGSPLEEIEMEIKYFDIKEMMDKIKLRSSIDPKYGFMDTLGKTPDEIAKQIIKQYQNV